MYFFNDNNNNNINEKQVYIYVGINKYIMVCRLKKLLIEKNKKEIEKKKKMNHL